MLRLLKYFLTSVLVLFSSNTQAAHRFLQPSDATTALCPSSVLALLRDDPACRASYHAGSVVLCLDGALWREWLQRGGSLCGEWSGRWKVRSPLSNDPHAAQKMELRVFQATSLPRGTAPQEGFARRLWRDHLILPIERHRTRFSQLLAPHDRLGLFRKLILGERTRESPEGMLRLLGMVHLFNATGIHLYAVSTLLGRLMLGTAQGGGISARIALPLTRVLVGFHWLWAWLLTGARSGMMRPWILILLGRGAVLSGFRWRSGAPLLAALLLDALVGALQSSSATPWGESGRWFYGLAVGGGILAIQDRKDWLHLRMAIGSWCFVALWELRHTHLVAVLTPLLSWITIPLLCVGIYPLLLLQTLLPSTLLDRGLEGANRAALWLVGWALDGPNLWVLPPAYLLLGGTLAGLTLWGFKTWTPDRRMVLLGPGLLMTLLAVGIARGGKTDELKGPTLADSVTQLDVGQGDAALVLAEDNTGLIDTGSERALTEERWLILLAQRGVDRLNWVGLTHLDQDHAGGVLRLGAIVPIGCVETSRAETRSARGQKLGWQLSAMRVPFQEFSGYCVPYPVLPPKGSSRESKKNGNMSAFLVPLTDGGLYVSPGDADADDEIRIGKWAEPKARAARYTLLKIAHHGSRFSSSPEFLNSLRPDEAWISSGIGNTYGHPSLQTLTELERRQIPVHRTDREGSLLHRAKIRPADRGRAP